jgi:hypothetical protein
MRADIGVTISFKSSQVRMNRNFITAIFIFTVFAVDCLAQEVGDSVRYAESIWSMKKKTAVLKYMQLSEAEKVAFWPIYESYSRAIQYVEMEQVQLLEQYSNFDELPVKKQDELSVRMLNNELALARVRRQYFKKFKKALSGEIASKFMQLDHSFRNMLHSEAEKDAPAMSVVESTMFTKNN